MVEKILNEKNNKCECGGELETGVAYDSSLGFDVAIDYVACKKCEKIKEIVDY